MRAVTAGAPGAWPARASLSRVAEQAAPIELRPLCLLLLPAELERFALRAHAEDLLSAPGRLSPSSRRGSARSGAAAGAGGGRARGRARRAG